MKKINLLMLLVFILSLLNISLTNAQEAPNHTKPGTFDMLFFYGKGCPHCAKEEAFLDGLKDKYPQLTVHEYEVYFNDSSRELMQQMADAYNTKIGGVPMTFINGKAITGFSDAIGKMMEMEVRTCIELGCICPLDMLKGDIDADIVVYTGESSPEEDPEKSRMTEQLTIWAVISGALVDSINPCEFAVLIILLTTIITASNRKRALWAGLAFSASIFISYFLMGLGLFSAIQASGITHTFLVIVAVLAIVIGLFNLKDYLWYGKWFIMEVPLSWRPKMKALIKSVTSVPGAFLIGFVVSLFLLPCTSGPYIVILGLLAKTVTRDYAIMLLLLYNFIFFLPMIAITLSVYFGFTTTEKAEEFRTRKLKTLHLIAAVIMVLLGIGLFIAMGLGLM